MLTLNSFLVTSSTMSGLPVGKRTNFENVPPSAKNASKYSRFCSKRFGLDDKAGFASQPTEFPKTPLKMIPCTAFFLDWLIDNLSSLK